MNPHTKFIIRARAVIVHEGKMLIVKHRPDSTYYALPGGHLEPAESPLECVEREIVEELGVEPQIGRLLYVHVFKNREVDETVEFFFEVKNGADFLNLEGLKRTHAHELAEILWIDPSSTLNLLPKSVLQDFKEGKLFSNETRYTKG
jgi:ADP-ribose pyrophosphatase YjhB (NUDIX family)